MNTSTDRRDSAGLLAEVTTIFNVSPLDAQFAVLDKRDTPDQLSELVFPKDTSIQTFALLDAAVVSLLPELLLQSGLEHKCLFTNDALDQFGTVGPWLVRLEANNAFTRNLFTHIPDKETGWHLWGKNAGIFLQSDKGFETVWKHVRKMVRVQNSKQDWFFFRFWDPQAAAGFWPVLRDNHTEVARRYGIGVLSCVFWQEDNSFRIVQVEKPATAIKRAPSLVETYESFLKKARWERFCRRVCRSAKTSEPTLQDVPDTRFTELCERAKALGFRRERAIYDLVLAYAICASKGVSIDDFHRVHLPAGRFPDDLTAAKILLLTARSLPDMEIQHG